MYSKVDGPYLVTFCYFLPYTIQILEVEVFISADVSDEARINPRKFWS